MLQHRVACCGAWWVDVSFASAWISFQCVSCLQTSVFRPWEVRVEVEGDGCAGR